MVTNPIDPERAYKRACELVTQIETEFMPRQSGRLRALDGFWSVPRHILLASLQVQLYGCPSFGLELDEWILGQLDRVANVAIRKRDLSIVHNRVAAYSGRGERPATGRGVHRSADGAEPYPATRNESNDLGGEFSAMESR